MNTEQMDERYLRIAELSEHIEQLTQLIELHKTTTQNESMIRQYQYKRDELITELQSLFKPLQLTISLRSAA